MPEAASVEGGGANSALQNSEAIAPKPAARQASESEKARDRYIAIKVSLHQFLLNAICWLDASLVRSFW